MIDNISRMYELAGIPVSEWYLCHPPFTAEKQLELIKWILENENSIHFYKTNDGYGVMTFSTDFDNGFETLEDCLALAICCQWELLTLEQREEVRGILQ